MVDNKQKIQKANFPSDSKFRKLDIPVLGMGTTWLGRKWPPQDVNYQYPDDREVGSVVKYMIKSGIKLFDTAPAYGSSEERLGMLLNKFIEECPEITEDLFVATKWGEEYEPETGNTEVIHSLKHLRHSISRSISFLPKIDLLYIHKANERVLDNKDVVSEMLSLVSKNVIRFTGASISNVNTLEKVVKSDLLWFDFVQTGALNIKNRPDIIEKLFNKGIAVVVNSPVRSQIGDSPKEAYLFLANHPHVSIVLTGTRHHFKETIEYFTE